jgi:hypothetical protein
MYASILRMHNIPTYKNCIFFAGPQISCFPPSNFTDKQAGYVDTYCWDTLMHHEFDSQGNFEERSLWVHKVSRVDLSRCTSSDFVVFGFVLCFVFCCPEHIFELGVSLHYFVYRELAVGGDFWKQ